MFPFETFPLLLLLVSFMLYFMLPASVWVLVTVLVSLIQRRNLRRVLYRSNQPTDRLTD